MIQGFYSTNLLIQVSDYYKLDYIHLSMAIKSKSVASDGKRVMTTEELKKWLKKFDTDKDGRISKQELRQAIRSTGGRFATFKSRRGLRSADVNQDGYIGEEELDNLVEFAQKYLGVRIIHF